MAFKQGFKDLPRALRETLETGWPEYQALVRRTRWGEGPIYMVGAGSSQIACMTGAYAFEGLLGWPVIVRAPVEFGTYTIAAVRPRSVVLAVSPSGDSDETRDAARAAQSRGAVLLALTSDSTSPLAKMADGVFLLRAGEEHGLRVKTAICQHAALCSIGLAAARTLKRQHPELDILEEEMRNLPGHVEWVLTQLPDAVRSFASELGGLRSLTVVGGGFYFPVALQGALLLREMTDIFAEGRGLEDFRGLPPEILKRDSAVVFLSGSRCRVKKTIRQLVGPAKGAGAKILSVTDSNDRDLAERSTLSVLLPVLSEMAGSTLTLALLAWVACHAAREEEPHADRRFE